MIGIRSEMNLHSGKQQFFRLFPGIHIASRYFVTTGEKEFRQSAHTDPAYADKVKSVYFVEITQSHAVFILTINSSYAYYRILL